MKTASSYGVVGSILFEHLAFLVQTRMRTHKIEPAPCLT